MSDLTYEASVYSRTVKYTNFKGETKSVELFFALDPLQLMGVIAGFSPKTNKKSGNPAKRNEVAEITDEQNIQFIRDLACKSAGFMSEDGESWESYENFENELAGKAFLTKLVSSDADRKEFAEKVILAPFRSFVGFAVADPDNTKAEVEQFNRMLTQMENIFTEKKQDESLEERRARLQAELEQMSGPAEGTQYPNL